MATKGLLLGLILVGITASSASAQDTASKSKAEVRSITGCLSKGDSADEFLLTASDGSTCSRKHRQLWKLDKKPRRVGHPPY
jgi:hypothetical protein